MKQLEDALVHDELVDLWDVLNHKNQQEVTALGKLVGQKLRVFGAVRVRLFWVGVPNMGTVDGSRRGVSRVLTAYRSTVTHGAR